MTTKQRAVEIISRLSDDVSVGEIMDELYAQMKIEEGLKQLDAGEGIEHKTVVARVRAARKRIMERCGDDRDGVLKWAKDMEAPHADRVTGYHAADKPLREQ